MLFSLVNRIDALKTNIRQSLFPANATSKILEKIKLFTLSTFLINADYRFHSESFDFGGRTHNQIPE